MILHFHKYQGTGNDFVLVDARDKEFPYLSQKTISSLCDRRFGIGADGLVLIRTHPHLDFSMVYYNSDGKEGTMCGNAGRCVIAFAGKNEIIRDHAKFEAIDGIHEGLISQGIVTLSMQPVTGVKILKHHFELNTGSPHYVRFVENTETVDVRAEGAAIRNHPRYGKKGINVNFISYHKNGIFVRTYERGVEDETLSCGTGVVASAICAAIRERSAKNAYTIYTRGGSLKISFTKSGINHFSDILLEGPAEFVYKGEIEIN